MRASLLAAPFVLVAAATITAGSRSSAQSSNVSAVRRVVANDNRRPAGTLRSGVLTLHLEARLGDWHPDGEDAIGATVPAFAEAGKPVQIPGPLIRVPAGTEVRMSVRNSMARTLTIRGLDDRLRTGESRPVPESVMELAPGASSAVRFKLDAPGTYYYFGSTRHQTMDWRSGDDSQLSGAIIVDPAGARPAGDRVFVIGVWSDTAGRVLAQRKRILSVVNGRSWPSTERLAYAVGDTVRWRVINASADSHPMHLHGFYFLVDGRGDARMDTTYTGESRPRANTEEVSSGRTMAMTWVAERPGNWLFHCHLPDHFRANGALGMRRESGDAVMRATDHGSMSHALSAMSGLVMGVTIRGSSRAAGSGGVTDERRLRLLIRPSAGGSSAQPYYAFSLSSGASEPSPDSGFRLGPPLVLTRGERARITVINALDKPTSVHWHGIELESYYDGVGGFSGARRRIAPVIAPHDSFVARMTPPRAGTFIYHTHVDETVQQLAGLAGPLIVLEPGRTLDSTTDHIVLITTPQLWEDELRSVLINGRPSPSPLSVRDGVPQRLRIINMTTRRPRARVELWHDSTLVQWRPLAKDGADLMPGFQIARPARSPISIGETMDYELLPVAGGSWRLEVRGLDGALLGTLPITVLPPR